VCCDETGTHHGAPITCVGGYVFDEDGEKEFTAEWVRFLQPFKQQGIEIFHANKCYGLNGEFEALDDDAKRELFTALIALTRRTAKFGMVSAIRDQVFGKVIQRNKFQAFTGSKYTVCALRSLTLIEQWADENRFDGEIIYVFEAGNEHQGEANVMMETIKKTPQMRKAFRYQRHEFIEKSLLPPLQAADMFVWLIQRWFSDNKPDQFLTALLLEGGISHWYQEITDLSLNMLALMNMNYGVKSGRKYESQSGRIKTYHM
jgi:hypothetical protein